MADGTKWKVGDYVRYTGSYAYGVDPSSYYPPGVIVSFRESATKAVVRLDKEGPTPVFADFPIDQMAYVEFAPPADEDMLLLVDLKNVGVRLGKAPDDGDGFRLHWTDYVANDWVEHYHTLAPALARFAVLLAAEDLSVDAYFKQQRAHDFTAVWNRATEKVFLDLAPKESI